MTSRSTIRVLGLTTVLLASVLAAVALNSLGDVEPNDSYAQAETLPGLGTYTGQVDGSGDWDDYYIVTVNVPNRQSLIVNVTPGPGSFIYGELDDDLQNLIRWNWGSASFLIYSDPVTPGGLTTFYIIVSWFGGADPGTYTLVLTTGTVDVTPPTIDADLTNPPTTGDTWPVGGAISDDVAVTGAFFQWMYASDPVPWPWNISTVNLTDNGAGIWTGNWSDPMNNLTSMTDSLIGFHYAIVGIDAFGNFGTMENNVTVTDNDAPVLGPDLTPAAVPAGTTLSFTAGRATDNIGVDSYWVEYWIDAGPHTTDILLPSGSNLVRTIPVPTGPATIHYLLGAKDRQGNAAWTPTRTAITTDDTKPTLLTDYTPSTVAPAESLRFLVVVTDDVAVDTVNVTYRIDGGAAVTVDMVLTGSAASHTITVPASARSITYTFAADDTFGNTATSTEKRIDVLDRVPPTIKADTTPSSAGTGTDLTIDVVVSDDVGLDTVTATFSFGSKAPQTTTLQNASGSDHFTATIGIPADSDDDLSYVVTAKDLVGNVAKSDQRTVTVTDRSKPNISADDSDAKAVAGGTYHFAVTATDNIAVASVEASVGFGSGTPWTVVLLPSAGKYGGTVEVPLALDALHYTVTVTDRAGNTFVSGEVARNVTDDHDPVVTDATGSVPAVRGKTITIQAVATDNLGVSTVVVAWHVGSGTPTEVTMTPGPGGIYTAQITVPKSGKSIGYTITAEDKAGRKASTSAAELTMVSPPVVTTGVEAGGTALLVVLLVVGLVVGLVIGMAMGKRRGGGEQGVTAPPPAAGAPSGDFRQPQQPQQPAQAPGTAYGGPQPAPQQSPQQPQQQWQQPPLQ